MKEKSTLKRDIFRLFARFLRKQQKYFVLDAVFNGKSTALSAQAILSSNHFFRFGQGVWHSSRGKSTRKIIAEKSNILNQESRAGRKRSARLFCVLSGFSDLHAIIFLASLTSVACVQMNGKSTPAVPLPPCRKAKINNWR